MLLEKEIHLAAEDVGKELTRWVYHRIGSILHTKI